MLLFKIRCGMCCGIVVLLQEEVLSVVVKRALQCIVLTVVVLRVAVVLGVAEKRVLQCCFLTVVVWWLWVLVWL